MRTEMKLMHQRLKTTTVYVTHDQIEAMTLGDKVAVMKDGIIQQFGTPKEIYNDPANLFVASFIGSPPMNFMRLQAQGRSPAGAARQRPGPLRTAAGHAGRRPGRPRSDPRAAPGADRAGDGEGNGRRDSRRSPGHRADRPGHPGVRQLNDTKVCCRLAPDVAPQVGETLTLQFDPAKVLLFDAKTGERLGTAASLPARIVQTHGPVQGR
jgi:multiple sugar transport system ATP-binding protein